MACRRMSKSLAEMVLARLDSQEKMLEQLLHVKNTMEISLDALCPATMGNSNNASAVLRKARVFNTEALEFTPDEGNDDNEGNADMYDRSASRIRRRSAGSPLRIKGQVNLKDSKALGSFAIEDCASESGQLHH